MAGAEWLTQQSDLLTRLALEPGPANQALRLRSAGAGRSRSAIPSSLRPPERDVRCRIPCLNVARVIRARGEISPGKDALLPRTTAGSTSFRAKSGSVPYFFRNAPMLGVHEKTGAEAPVLTFKPVEETD